MSGIQEYFEAKTVLVTGATGFLGGVLLERLLSSCPGLKEVCVIARSRNGQEPAERLKALLSLQLFEKLSEDIKKKVTLMPGDLGLPNLGLCENDLDRIKQSVHVVFHVAANVNFSSALDKAIITNLGGTNAVLALAKEIINIEALVYVSTAYCNCTFGTFIEEKVYPSQWEPLQVLRTVSECSTSMDKISEEYLMDYPNTYTFSKKLAENLLMTERGDLPVAIVRPSIVLNTAERPFEGWTYNVMSGAFAFIAGAGRGAFRTIYAEGDRVADLVPSDYLAAFIIAAAWRTAANRDLKVYHYTSGRAKPVLWSEYVDGVMKYVEEYPTENAILMPRARCRSSYLHNWIVVLLFHFLPACFIDFFGTALDVPGRVLEIQKKYARGMNLASFFTLNQWSFNTSNTEQLWKEMSEEDKKEFWFSLEYHDWDTYFKTCVLGVRQYYHRQDNSDLKLAKTGHLKRKFYYYCGWIIFYILMVCFLQLFLTSTSSVLLYSLVFVLYLYWL